MANKHHASLNRTPLLDSVVTRLLLLALCIVLFGAAVRYYVLTNFLREDLGAVVEAQQLALATYVAHDVDNKIVQRQLLLERLAASVPLELLKQPEPLRQWLKEHYQYQTLFSTDLFIVNARGELLVDYPEQSTPQPADHTGRDYIQAGLEGRSFVGQPVAERGTGNPLLPMSTPIRNRDGEVQAVLVGVTALAAPGFLDSLLKSRVGDATGGFQLVFVNSKTFVEPSSLDMVLKPVPPAGRNVLFDKAIDGFRGAGITLNSDGEEEVSAMASVNSVDWFIVARVPSSEAFATVDRTRLFLIKGAGFSVLVFSVLASIGLYFVFRHLFRAAARADRMTRDELPLAPLPIVRNDEVGHLIAAFNRLLVKLNDKQAELQDIAHHDSLTGLPNRHHLAGQLRQALALAERNEGFIGLLFMDLDGFKDVNDTHGHEAGDEVLRQVAMRFSSVVRESDTLARIGGDEFVVLLSDLGEDAEVTLGIVASKCINALNMPFMISGAVCSVGVSVGVALGTGGHTADELLLAADRVMYQAKKSGRGRYVSCRLDSPLREGDLPL